jgi:hypothetical protein
VPLARYRLKLRLVLGGLLPLVIGLASSLLYADEPSPSVVTPEQVDGLGLRLPQPGQIALRILSPTLLEVTRIGIKNPDPDRIDAWDLVDATGGLHAPEPGQVLVTANGQNMAVTTVGFKRRPRYAPLAIRDLRIDSRLYLQLAQPVADEQTVTVTNPDASLWLANLSLNARMDPFRYSPAIHVNEEGYEPAFPKEAMVGAFLGSLGELAVPVRSFQLIDTATGQTAFTGFLTPRREVGFVKLPPPYQAVCAADFSAFTKPGTYRLLVPGLGASLPFRIREGVAMDFARAYALGLYQQR